MKHYVFTHKCDYLKLNYFTTVYLGFSLHVYTVTMFRVLRMGQQEVCVLQEVTVLWLRHLPSPAPPAPSATALASADLRSVSAVHWGNATHILIRYQPIYTFMKTM